MRCRLTFVLVILLVVSLLKLSAQSHNNADSLVKPIGNKNKYNSVSLKYEYDLGSVLNNNFISKILFGGNIDQGIIDDNYKRLNSGTNHLGNDVNVVLQYRKFNNHFLGMNNVGFSTAIEWHINNNFNFTKDGYSLLMEGNRAFAGKTADLSHTEYYSSQYSQFKLGLYTRNEAYNSEYGFQISLNFGNQFETYNTPNAEFYTEPNGEYVQLKGTFDYYEAASSGIFKGIGTGIDLFYKIEKKQRYNLLFDISNIGFIYWNSNSLNYNGEENIKFEGIVIDDLFSTENNQTTSINDSLTDYINANGEVGSFMTFTPVEINIGYEYCITNNISVLTKFRHKLISLYSPYYQLGAVYHINNKYHIGGDVNYGGFTKLNFGLSLCMEISDNFVLDLRTRYISGLFGQAFSGIGGIAQINFKF